jgi:hypothetical protein
MNLYQLLSYEPAWRNAETLWQYHLSLPRPSYIAYENLAAYYYAEFSSAHAQKNTPLMVLSLKKMEAVTDAGLEQFWPDRSQPTPPDTSYLFFLRSLVQQVKGDPNGALNSLLMSDRLKPRFPPTDLNLSLLYQNLAGSAKNPQQQKVYLEDARDRFAQYMMLTYRGRPAPPDVQKQLASLEAECKAPPQLPPESHK